MGGAKAVVLVGGPSKGTRMRPLTLDIPKPLIPIAGRPIIWHGLQALSKLDSLTEVLLIGFYEDSVFSSFVRSASRDFPNLSIRYMREYTSLGTAGGLYHFRDTILKGAPDQIFVMHADIACFYPLAEIQAFHAQHRGVGTLMSVRVPRESATKFGCIVVDQGTGQARHYVEKPQDFISENINGGVYLFDKGIFEEIRVAMDEKTRRAAEDPLSPATSFSPVLPSSGGPLAHSASVPSFEEAQLRLEQDVIAPLCARGKIFVYDLPEGTSGWTPIKHAGSALPANALLLSSYKKTNPTLLRRRSPTIIASSRAAYTAGKKGPEIVEPCFIDETATVDPSAKIGPNVSIGAGVQIGFGVRVKDAILFENSVLEKSSVVQNAIVGAECHLGPWARVEGIPFSEFTSPKKEEEEGIRPSVCILAREVTVAAEVQVRSCVVLPNKVLDRGAKCRVLL